MNFQNKYSQLLSQYQPVSLEELDELALMKRVDKKFVVPIQHLSALFEKAKNHYKILEISGFRAFSYSTNYFDTSDFHLYQMHHNGMLNRQKVRYRTYEVSNTTFLEIKTKNNKEITQKTRIRTTGIELATNKEQAFVEKTLFDENIALQKSLCNSFYRIMLLSFETKERISIDYNLSFSLDNKGVKLPYIAIVEVKREKCNINSPIISLLKELKVYPRGFSKYCMGIALLNSSIKKNTFKPNILHLTKLEHEHNFA